MEEKGKVIEHKSDLYTTYDVTDKGYCINERPRPALDVLVDVRKQLWEKYSGLKENEEYFDIFPGQEGLPWPLDNRFLCIFYVRGGSEGYYVHVETQHEGRNTIWFLGKTLREGEAGMSWAEQMVCALSRIMKP